MAETISEIDSQLHAAALGIRQTVTDMHTSSGVKDHIAQHWIELLMVRGAELRTRYLTDPTTRDPRLNDRRVSSMDKFRLREQIEDQIRMEQREWLVRQPPHRYQNLPENSGKELFDECVKSVLTFHARQSFVTT